MADRKKLQAYRRNNQSLDTTTLQLVERPDAPDAFANEAIGPFIASGNVVITFATLRANLIWKQLQPGVFRWPPVMDGVIRLSAVELAALFDGLDWTQVQAAPRIPTSTAVA